MHLIVLLDDAGQEEARFGPFDVGRVEPISVRLVIVLILAQDRHTV
jgi:hypothetical protein